MERVSFDVSAKKSRFTAFLLVGKRRAYRGGKIRVRYRLSNGRGLRAKNPATCQKISGLRRAV